MCVLSALTTLAVFDIAVATAGPAIGWLVWLSIGVTVPVHSACLGALPRDGGRSDRRVGDGLARAREAAERSGVDLARLCLAWLPWLHTKFSVLLAGLAVLLAWQLRRQMAHGAGVRHAAGAERHCVAGFFHLVYGTIDPQAPMADTRRSSSASRTCRRSLLGLLFDQKFGLLVYAPIYAFIAVGLWIGSRQPALVVPGALAVVYALSSARLYMPAGRFERPRALPRARASAAGAGAGPGGGESETNAVEGGAGGLRAAEPRHCHRWRSMRVNCSFFSSPHGFACMVQLVQGSAPLMSALPTFTEENWLGPLSSLLPWCVAAGVAVAVARLCARFGSDRVWVAPGGVTAFLIGGALFASSFSPDVRAESSRRGTQALLQAFDPIRARALHYAQLTRLTPAAWLSRATLTVDHRPGDAVDCQGRVTDALALPAGRDVARVWFDGGRPRAGAIEAIAPGGSALTRIDGPLPNPSELDSYLPVAAPTLWVRATDPESARGVRRVELSPREVFAHDRQAAIASRRASGGTTGRIRGVRGPQHVPRGRSVLDSRHRARGYRGRSSRFTGARAHSARRAHGDRRLPGGLATSDRN